jgi:hypothetical protein
MRSLVERRETPYRKWVTLSDEIALFREIEEASNDKNWEQIVDVLARPPAQFIGDIFWRRPLVTRWRSLTVAKMDSIGLVVRRWIQCSAG